MTPTVRGSGLLPARTVIPNAAAASVLAVSPAGVRAGVTTDLVLTADDVLAAFRA